MSQNLDAAERYQLAIYDVPFDASSPHNYAVWQGFKLCRILALELEGRLNDKTALLAAVEAAAEEGYDKRDKQIHELQLSYDKLFDEAEAGFRKRDTYISELELELRQLKNRYHGL